MRWNFAALMSPEITFMVSVENFASKSNVCRIGCEARNVGTHLAPPHITHSSSFITLGSATNIILAKKTDRCFRYASSCLWNQFLVFICQPHTGSLSLTRVFVILQRHDNSTTNRSKCFYHTIITPPCTPPHPWTF